jgi:hypothetical protein
MSIAPPIPDNSRDLVLSEHPQLLIVCLLVGLFFCGAIVLYTNQVKGKAVLLAQDSYSGGSAAPIVPPSDTTVPSPVLRTVAIDRSQHTDVSLNAKRDKQQGLPANHKATTDRLARTELALQRVPVSRPGTRKLPPTPMARGSVSVNLFRTRSRNGFVSHHRTTLIALWRQSLKRHQNDKLSHLTPNPST